MMRPDMRHDLPKPVRLCELRVADVIDLGLHEGYGTATVENIEGDVIKTLRPYVHDGGFLTTAGVITYIGWEYVTLDKRDIVRQVTLLRRSNLK